MTKEARIDFARLTRLGMIEAIWGEHKTSEQIVEILRELEQYDQLAFVTRVSREKADHLLNTFDQAEFHEKAHCLTLGVPLPPFCDEIKVAVVSGGTSDLCVSAEAALALRLHGINAEMFLDIGVAGLHRVLENMDKLKKFNVVIACAGMEGALPTVLAGLIPQPVIGVPVSVGYGVSKGGRAALEGMLASCAPGLTVVNIDNGYGAAMAALRIIKSSFTNGLL
ncbi:MULTISPECIES: nickel pincer cofactor biosynthesis protein LarB [Prochlorococcus]|uniref:nickel pincer cofactor biosynthesis protein LarB n=1 Tax=Prochlorococcus TaxID=1218 RepID=UPI0005337FF9|nr:MULTISPECIES: nickel pincer cofactor biosynthesis protein LarB [Prochlorococcus]KGG12011.1 Circadian phase modifier [Prochlorococcus sp. MIT 0601]